MDSENEKKYQRLRSFFFGLCILAAGLFFLVTSKNIYKSLSAENWPTYPGVIASGRGSSGWYATSFLKYTYEVDGKKFTASRAGYGTGRPNTKLDANAPVKVFVNPHDPEDAVLVVGFSSNHFTGLLFSGGFFWLALHLWRKTK